MYPSSDHVSNYVRLFDECWKISVSSGKAAQTQVMTSPPHWTVNLWTAKQWRFIAQCSVIKYSKWHSENLWMCAVLHWSNIIVLLFMVTCLPVIINSACHVYSLALGAAMILEVWNDSSTTAETWWGHVRSWSMYSYPYIHVHGGTLTMGIVNHCWLIFLAVSASGT